MNQTRRSILSVIGAALPFVTGTWARASRPSPETVPVLRFHSFEEAVRAAFSDRCQSSICHRIEIGHSEQVRAGVQGCYNDRPFAGFPAGHLRIVQTRFEPGPIDRGVRLYISTVEVALTGGVTPSVAGRPLDFASLPPAPSFS